MNILGIDYGSSKIGLALASSESRIAGPFKVIYEKSLEKQVAAVSKVITTEQISTVVVGLPSSRQDAKETPQTHIVKKFVAALQASLPAGITFALEDERLSTKMSKKLLQDIKSGDDDAVAAACILQAWLDRGNLA